MNISATTNTIRIICEQQGRYNEHNRKDLLQGIYFLADICVEHLDENGGEDSYPKAWTEIQLIKDFAEDGLQKGELDSAFYHIKDAVLRVVGLPE